MRVVTTVPVAWPTPETVRRLWSGFFEPGGPLNGVVDDLPQGDTIVRTAGDGWRAGAAAEFRSPRLTLARVTGRVEGPVLGAPSIVVDLTGHDPARRISGTLRTSDTEDLRSVAGEGRIGPLTWEVALDHPALRAHAHVSVPWLGLRIELSGERGRPEGSLTCHTELTTHGPNKPLLYAVLRAFLGQLRKIQTEGVTDLARAISDLDVPITRSEPDDSAPTEPIDYDTALQLDFLRSPWSTVRRLQQAAKQEPAQPPQ